MISYFTFNLTDCSVSFSMAAILPTWCDPANSIVAPVAAAARRIRPAGSTPWASRASVGKNAVLQPPGRFTTGPMKPPPWKKQVVCEGTFGHYYTEH